MSFIEYIQHYIAFPGILWMVIVSLAVVVGMHLIIVLYTKYDGQKKELYSRYEMYYEMLFSSTAILFFTGFYFLIDYHYFQFSDTFYVVWDKYNDFLLLLALIISILLVNLMDSVFVPLRHIGNSHKGTLRMMGMIYMLIIFAYIKFIYQDDNYDGIIIYFLIMIVGRFVYFDASFSDFLENMRSLLQRIPILLMALTTTGIMAFYGFQSGYLLKSNGVVVSLWIAHVFLLVEVCIAHHVEKLRTRRG